MSLDGLLSGDALVSLVTLTAMEIVLGIDNVVFIAILVGRLPVAQQSFARRIGLTLALVIRVGLLLAISWMMGLTAPLFSLPVLGQTLSGRDLILIGGGFFLIAKATWEIYDKLEADHAAESARGSPDRGSARARLRAMMRSKFGGLAGSPVMRARTKDASSSARSARLKRRSKPMVVAV